MTNIISQIFFSFQFLKTNKTLLEANERKKVYLRVLKNIEKLR